MLKLSEDGSAMHFPADPNCFKFDSEVSAVFPSMAKRAIPNFYEAHASHARMLNRWVHPGMSVMDVGASRGAFFMALKEAHPEAWSEKHFNLHAIDNSADMCDHLCREFPMVNTQHMDITCSDFLGDTTQYDVVCAHYVLQFVPEEMQDAVVRRLMEMVKPGGVFIYGHKSRHYGTLGSYTHDEYLLFRQRNGYTVEEIEAKTTALKGSMFPVDHARLVRTLNAEFSEVVETYRFMMFSTLFARK